MQLQNLIRKCKSCGRYNTEYCLMCKEKDLYVTKEQQEYLDYMCDLMCGCVEEEDYD